MNFPDENNNFLVTGTLRSLRQTKNTRNIQKCPYFNESAASNIYNKSKSKKLVSCTLNNTYMLRLDDSFYRRPCITLAKDLLGKILVRKLPSGGILKGMIVETESYLGIIDMASHSFKGKRTDRNEAMFLKPGTAYVYSIYGMYYCFNISSLEEGSAVLIRALEPLQGISDMNEHRRKGRKSTSEIKLRELCNGPSKLCQAFQIYKELFNKMDLSLSENLWVEEGITIDTSNIICCKRIGIDSYGEEWANKPLRFYVNGSIFVSKRCKIAERNHEGILST